MYKYAILDNNNKVTNVVKSLLSPEDVTSVKITDSHAYPSYDWVYIESEDNFIGPILINWENDLSIPNNTTSLSISGTLNRNIESLSSSDLSFSKEDILELSNFNHSHPNISFTLTTGSQHSGSFHQLDVMFRSQIQDQYGHSWDLQPLSLEIMSPEAE